ncbi:putative transcription factor bZIP family [Helianthus annuus]|uniref:Putative basic-leucine zipper domain-containing protein n=1 Tax=Helianthus annuus TaxID=4232 RepID=A0A251T6K4_HELAN|nr:bZIP transcription factor 2-like [Helianthus annuus]KAF5780198.1 putative transcription factor bZIP family [Helianthus annuus]KAJ0500059.1 putative transcription factor bZIP family [Helianthus annuus]KAJ0515886.1 putative transcription factor bZIP family [Helianthus annuus]KAJ0687864.1 putative transcription factor bZIP family [Helianthus annuus]KAJ0868874.1 putative transcription factor bZIP family [Helianthus annuus]
MSSSTNFLNNILLNYPLQAPVPNITNSTTSSSDETRNKRKISNRESARRSRMRKQKHLEDVKSQVTRYKMVNHQLMNRLRLVNHNGQIVQQENQWLLLELVMLQQKLNHLHNLMAEPELHHTLLPSAWPCNNNVTTVFSDQNQLPLVTL